jgi:hypothetical protein
MKRCRLKRSNFQIKNKMTKYNKTLDKHKNGNDFIADVSGSFSLKFWEENMIRNKMIQSEKLIKLLESRDFQIEFNVGEKWFDDTMELVKKECKAHLINCAERLVRSKNYC